VFLGVGVNVCVAVNVGIAICVCVDATAAVCCMNNCTAFGSSGGMGVTLAGAQARINANAISQMVIF
jgi:hypothetical protein